MEVYAFSLPGWGDEYEQTNRMYRPVGEDASISWQQYQLDELQGCYLILLVQYWAGNKTAAQRVSQIRLAKWISVSAVSFA